MTEKHPPSWDEAIVKEQDALNDLRSEAIVAGQRDPLKHKRNVEAYERRKARSEVEAETLFDGTVKGDLPGRASRRSTGGRPKRPDRP